MQKFSDFSKKVKMEHSELLIQEAKELSIKSEDSEQILESLNVLCDNLILSYITEQDKVKSVDGICLPEVFEGIPFYNYESVQSRLIELENVKIG